MNMNLTKTSWGKAILALAMACVLLPNAFGQGALTPVRSIDNEENMSAINRNVLNMLNLQQNPIGQPTPEAMWDIEYTNSITDSIPGGATGATLSVGFNGTEYWMAQWTDSLFHRFDASGTFIESFVIPDGLGGEIGGTLGISWDGTSFYLTNGSTTVYEVNPTTKTLVGTFNIPEAAFISCYDPTLDGGNGGLWTNGWGPANGGEEDLIAVSFSGTELSRIPFADHTLFAALGLAYDATSTGGPYLWGFDQSGDGATIKQILMPSGQATVVSRDANADFGFTGVGLSGGLFIADTHPNYPGQRILGGVVQNRISFGYDLDFSPILIDASLSLSTPLPGYTILPLSQAGPIEYAGFIIGEGSNTITSTDFSVNVTSGGTTIFNDNTIISNLGPNDTVLEFVGPWTPIDTGEYNIDLNLDTGAQVDQDNGDNSASYTLIVGDSVMARDNGQITGSLGFPNGANDDAILGQNYILNSQGSITSISFFLNAAPIGDVVSASVYSTDADGVPTTEILETVTYTVTAADNQNGVFLTLPFAANPLTLPAGEYFIGVNEPGDNLTLATTRSIYEPGNVWIRANSFAGGAWVQVENAGGFEIAFVVRPNFGPCAPTYLRGNISIDDDDSGNGDAILTFNPNGGTAPYTYEWTDAFGSTTQTINNVVGGQAYSVTVTDANGCVATFTSDVVNVWPTDIEDELAVGIKAFNIFPNPNNGQFELNLNLEQAANATVRVFDVTGTIVETVALPRAQEVSHTFDLSNQAAGIYLIQVQTPQGSATRRVSVR